MFSPTSTVTNRLANTRCWIGHWPAETPAQLRELKKQGKISLQQSVWVSWVELSREVGPEMKK